MPHVPALVVGSLLGRLPYGMSSLSLVLFVQAQTGSFAPAGVVAAAAALAAALGAPLLGRVIDRRGQTTVLLGAVAVHTTGLVVLVLLGRAGAPVALLAVIAATTGAATPPLSPCLRALWPVVLGDRAAVRTALALDALVIEVVFIGGPLAVAVIVAIASPAAGLLAAGALALVGTLLFAAQPPSRSRRGSARRGRGPSPLLAPGIRTLLIGALGVGIVFGSLEVALPAFGAERGQPGIAGVALAMIAAGSAVGGLTYGARTGTPGPPPGAGPAAAVAEAAAPVPEAAAPVPEAAAPVPEATATPDVRPLYLGLLAALPIAVAPLLAAGSVLTLLVLAPLAGLAIAPLTAAENELAGTVTPEGTVTEAYAWMLTALVGGVAAGNALAGALVEASGWRTALAVACGCAASSALVTILRRRTLVRR